MNYWLLKSEPSEFSIDDLAQRPKQTEPWDGVRNYQARNMLRDKMKKGDLAFFYHSNTAQPGIAGIAKILSALSKSCGKAIPTTPHLIPKINISIQKAIRPSHAGSESMSNWYAS